MRNKNLRSHFIRLCTAPVVVGLVALALPVQASYISPSSGAFQRCASTLKDAGIGEQDAADACAGALHPVRLSICVSRIQGNTTISAEDALSSCYRVRRPLELASCVVRIDVTRDDAVASGVLDYCRRSLLPRRFASCVVGLTPEIEFATPVAFDTCIAAGGPPNNVLPTYIPRSEVPTTSGPRLTPLVPIQ